MQEPTRAELIEALTNLNVYAKRQQHIVERFRDDPPTLWTRAHQRINDTLDGLEEQDK